MTGAEREALTVKRVFKALVWSVVGLATVLHLAGGWFLSSQLIEERFAPEPAPIAVPDGPFRLSEVTYEAPLGDYDAWFLSSVRQVWVIHVHAINTGPGQFEHLFERIQDAGYPQLAITYRNDDGQPTDPSGYHQYGQTEWEDVDAAVAFAVNNGASGVVLSGFGDGAAHVLSFAYRSDLEVIKGLVLDSPNLDVADSLRHIATQRNLPGLPISTPGSVAWAANFLTSVRLDVNWRQLDYIQRAKASLRVPVLIRHGVEDEVVPIDQSLSLLMARPDLVEVNQVSDAGHLDAYATDPTRYLEELLSFLHQVG